MTQITILYSKRPNLKIYIPNRGWSWGLRSLNPEQVEENEFKITTNTKVKEAV